MLSHYLFILALLLTLWIFARTTVRYVRLFRITKPAFPVEDIPRRILLTLKVAFGQSKILQRPVIGMLHALVFWGFLIILFGSLEIVVDGLTDRMKAFHTIGPVYAYLMAAIDLMAPLIAVVVIIFWIRRNIFHVHRFSGPEITKRSHRDANITLGLIFLLMLTITGMNTFYAGGGPEPEYGSYPFSEVTLVPLVKNLSAGSLQGYYRMCWWIHVLTIFFFANYLPYSKHFHVYLSLPNVFLSRTYPMGELPDMPQVTSEVGYMMSGEEAAPEEEVPERFGILDVEDITWKNYLDALTCTQCGRCTAVCPANQAGSLLSPRKIMMDTRRRIENKAPLLLKEPGKEDGKTLLGSYISEEELWACTLCDACVRECPLNINQPEMIIGMRRYEVLEKAAAPAEWNTVYTNIENNGALWKMPVAGRMRWAEDLYITKNGKKEKVEVPVMAKKAAGGKRPEYLLWTGSAGAFDSRYRKVMQDFVRILAFLDIDYAVLGEEEISSGDFARRTGNEMLFVMQAKQNIELFNHYGVTQILTCDPHVYNTFKNEYPAFGDMPGVIHHTQFLEKMIREKRIILPLKGGGRERVTYHDPCYLGRINGEYEAPRKVLRALGFEIKEMPRHKANALCCGGGGGQMFRESKHGENEIFLQRTREALNTGAETVVTACPYCMTMLGDGIKYEHAEERVAGKDLAELVAEAMGI